MCMSWLVPPPWELLEVTDSVFISQNSRCLPATLQHRSHYLSTHCGMYFMCLHGQMTMQQARARASCLPVDLLPLRRGLWENASKGCKFSNYFKAKTYKNCSFFLLFFIYIPLGFSRLPTLKILRYLEPQVDREVGRWWAPRWSKEEAQWRHSPPSVASQGHQLWGKPMEDTSS